MASTMQQLKDQMVALLDQAVEHGRALERQDMAERLGLTPRATVSKPYVNGGKVATDVLRPTAAVRKVYLEHGLHHPLPVGRAIEYSLALAPDLSEQQIRTAIKVLYDADKLTRIEKGVYQAGPKMEIEA